ncbi:hypothetical protein BV20DRAFT_973118, partial [Pilatotrama ljubarskyi]
MLERLAISTFHSNSTRCCRALFGAGDEAVPGDETVRSLLPNMVELIVHLNRGVERQYDSGTCAGYLASVLPSMRDVFVLLDSAGRRIELAAVESRATVYVGASAGPIV